MDNGKDARIDMDWTVDDIKAYVEQLKASGLSRSQYEDENNFSMVSMESSDIGIILMPQGIILRLK